jgi:hypothetical protein
MRAALRTLLPLCLLLTSPLAWAQADGGIEFASGFIAGPELAPGGFGLWVDRGYGVWRSTSVTARATESAIRCSDFSVYPPVPHGPDLVDRTSEDPHFFTQYETVATGYPGEGHFYLVSQLRSVLPAVQNANIDAGALAGKVGRQVRIYRGECPDGGVKVAEVVLDAEAGAALSSALDQPTARTYHSMDEGGSLYLRGTRGLLVRVDLQGPTPTVTRLLDQEVLKARLDADLSCCPGTEVPTLYEVLGVAGTTPQRALVSVARRIGTGTPRYVQWLLEVSGTDVRVLRGPDTTWLAGEDDAGYARYGGQLVVERSHDLVLMPGAFSHPTAAQDAIAALPRTDGGDGFQRPWSWTPLHPGKSMGTMVQSSEGAIYGVANLGQLFFDDSRLDLDGDGLPSPLEAARGTSDFLADTDGDGVIDIAELTTFGTSPLDAGSAPVRTPTAPRLAPSTLISDWRALQGVNRNPPDPSGQLLCVATSFDVTGNLSGRPADFRCHTPTGVLLPGLFYTEPVLSRDGRYAYYRGNKSELRRRDLTSKTPEEVLMPGANFRPIAVEDDAVMNPITGALRRVGESEWISMFQRHPCTEREDHPASCLADVGLLAQEGVRFLGMDRPRQRALFLLGTGPLPGKVVSVGSRSLEVLGDVGSAFAFLSPTSMGEWPDGGFLVTYDDPERPFGKQMWLVDETLAPLRRVSARPTVGPFFRQGMLELDGTTFDHPAPQGTVGSPCMGSDGIFVCDSPLGQNRPYKIYVNMLTEHVPVSETVEPGETLFFAAAERDVPDVPNPLTDRWSLWRLTALGGADRWLDRAAFQALMDGRALGSASATPLDRLSHLGVSEDGLRVCLVEPANQRLWELLLDGASRRPSAVRLVASGEPFAACAYDAAGEVAWLVPGAARVSGATVSLPSITTPTGMVRHGAHYFFQDRTAAVQCLEAGGVRDTGLRAAALAPYGRGLVVLHQNGNVELGLPEELCRGEAARERLGTDVFTAMQKLTRDGTVRAFTAKLALRPDGIAYLMANELDTTGETPGTQGEAVPLLWRLRPQFAPLDWDRRMEEFDARRRANGPVSLAVLHATGIGGVASLPGGNFADDWEYFGMTPPAPVTRPADAGVGDVDGGDKGLAPPPEEPESCGCGAGAVSPFLLASLVATLLLARRRER